MKSTEENRLKRNAYMRKWNKRNYQRLKEEGKLFKQTQPDKYKESHKKAAKKWVKNNPNNAKEISKRYRKNNPKKIKSMTDNYRKNNPENVVAWNKRGNLKRYGITLEQYDALLFSQNNRCAICEKHQSELKKSMCVDHCHSTGIVRGLLCHKCNTSLGGFGDNVELLKKAIVYLK